MCGIALLYNPSIVTEQQRQMMQNSLDAMKHRGPDDDGIWQDQDIIIGHRRLSIIDLAASRQPMVDSSNRYILTYNGEIYNYKELRAELEGRWRFRTLGDTEVLLAGIVLHGDKFLKKMEGMWAFAFWDNLEKKLLVCRDRMGKKPLYYQDNQGGFICASELPALACLKNYSWDEDLDSSADYLRHGYYLPGTTAYKNVREVLPGQYMIWSSGNTCIKRSYWTLSLKNYKGSQEQATIDLEQYIVEAVDKRLVADVEVGAFLSGGVDSSLIVSIMTKKLGVCPKTFTIGFEEHSYDERRFAQLIADYCATTHYTGLLRDWDRQHLTDLIFKNIGQPFADSSLLPTSLVSGIAASHVKVALSGDGGDELFSGYQRYQARTILRWYTRLPKCLRTGIAKALRVLPEPMSHHSSSFLKKAHLFQDIVDRLESENPYVAPVLYSGKYFNLLFPDLKGLGHSSINIPEECNIDDITRMMTADAIVYLPQDILLKVDRASMSHSLETRAPYLDRKVVELAFSLPRPWHRSGFEGKKMLHRSFKKLLPEIIWKRRKQGFGVPIYQWFNQDLGNELKELLVNVNASINSLMVNNMIEEHRCKQRDHAHRLWSIYIYLLWKEQLL